MGEFRSMIDSDRRTTLLVFESKIVVFFPDLSKIEAI